MDFNMNDKDRIPENGLYKVFIPNKTCNLACKYCNTDESEFLKKMAAPESAPINSVLESARSVIDSEILKVVGGGEAFLDKNLEHWIKQQAPHYTTIFILTNGIAVKEERLKSLARLNNLHMGLSLDGNSLEMNSYRYEKKELFEKVINTFKVIGQLNIPLQVNMVMHDRNCTTFFDYLDFLLESGSPITLHTSPVMIKESNPEQPTITAEWIANLERLLSCYERYSSILLPAAYYQYLIEFLKSGGKRAVRCYIPYFMLQLFSTGELTPCPIVWNSSLGNVLEPESLPQSLYGEKIYSLLNHPKSRLPFCKGCSSSYDILNLYMAGRISTEELAGIKLFSPPSTQARLKEIKSKILEGVDNE